MNERKETGSGTRSFPRTGLTGQKSPLVSCSRVSNKCNARVRAARFYEVVKARTRTRASNEWRTRKSGKDGELRGRMGRGRKERTRARKEGVRTRPLPFLHLVGNRYA